jgi:hypothetical protein
MTALEILTGWRPWANRRHRAGSKTDAQRACAAVDEATLCSKRLCRIFCTPLRIEQRVLQKVVVPARPVPSLPLPPLPQKPKRLE